MMSLFWNRASRIVRSKMIRCWSNSRNNITSCRVVCLNNAHNMTVSNMFPLLSLAIRLIQSPPFSWLLIILLPLWARVRVMVMGIRVVGLGLGLGFLKGVSVELHCEHDDSLIGGKYSLPAEPTFRWLIVRKRGGLSLMTQHDAAVIQKCNWQRVTDSLYYVTTIHSSILWQPFIRLYSPLRSE